MRGYVKTTELAEIMDCSRQWVYKQEQEQDWKTMLAKGAKWYEIKSLPEPIRAQIKARKRGILELSAAESMTDTLPEWKRRLAADRFRLLSQLDEALRDPDNAGLSKLDIIERFARRYNRGEIAPELYKSLGNKSSRTLQRWMATYNSSDTKSPVETLAPSYGVRKGCTSLNEAEQEYLRGMYLRPRTELNGVQWDIGQNRLSMAFVYRRYLESCKTLEAQGQEIKVASYDTVRRFLAGISLKERIRFREGQKAYHDKAELHAQRDYSTIEVNEIWTSDGHTLNLMVKEGDAEPARPTLVVIMDMRTRRIMGFDIQLTESSQTVVNAMTDAIVSNGCVVPKRFYIDNGKAFKNKYTMGKSRGKMLPGHYVPQNVAGEEIEDEQTYFSGVYAELGIRTSFAQPYNSAAKGTIEKLWKFIDEDFSKRSPSYVGKDAMSKPEILKDRVKDKRAFPTLDQVREAFGAWVASVYNDHSHRGQAMELESPNAVYATAEKLRTVPLEQVVMAVMMKERRTVRRDGIQYLGYRYYDREAQYTMYLGQTVFIAINPHDLNSVHVLDKDKNYLFRADRHEPISMQTANADSIAQLRERKRLTRQTQVLENQKTTLLTALREQDTTREAAKFFELAGPAPSQEQQAEAKRLVHMMGED